MATTSKIGKRDVDLTPQDIGAVSDTHSKLNLSTSLLSYASNNTPEGLTFFTLSGSDYTGDDVPTDNCKYGHGYISRRSNDIDVMLVEAGSSRDVYFNHCYKGTWSGWTNRFLPLTGGTLTANEFYTGGGTGRWWGGAYTTSMQKLNVSGDSTNLRGFQVNDSNSVADKKYAYVLLDRVNGDHKEYQIFGQHNKPSGSYTGNGSATERVIDLGALIATARLVYIYNGTQGTNALMGGASTLCWAGSSVKALPISNGEITNDGKLILKTTDDYLNKSGNTYFWYVL